MDRESRLFRIRNRSSGSPTLQPSLDYGGSEDRNRAKQNDRGDNPKKKLVSRTRGIVHPIACAKNKIDLWFFYDNSLYSFQNP